MHVCLYAHVFQSKAAPVLGFTDMIPGVVYCLTVAGPGMSVGSLLLYIQEQQYIL